MNMNITQETGGYPDGGLSLTDYEKSLLYFFQTDFDNDLPDTSSTEDRGHSTTKTTTTGLDISEQCICNIQKECNESQAVRASTTEEIVSRIDSSMIQMLHDPVKIYNKECSSEIGDLHAQYVRHDDDEAKNNIPQPTHPTETEHRNFPRHTSKKDFYRKVSLDLGSRIQGNDVAESQKLKSGFILTNIHSTINVLQPERINNKSEESAGSGFLIKHRVTNYRSTPWHQLLNRLPFVVWADNGPTSVRKRGFLHKIGKYLRKN